MPLSTAVLAKIAHVSVQLVPSEDRPSMFLLCEESTRLLHWSPLVPEKLLSETSRALLNVLLKNSSTLLRVHQTHMPSRRRTSWSVSPSQTDKCMRFVSQYFMAYGFLWTSVERSCRAEEMATLRGIEPWGYVQHIESDSTSYTTVEIMIVGDALGYTMVG